MKRGHKSKGKAVEHKRAGGLLPGMLSDSVPEGGPSRRLVAGICAGLAMLVLAVFSQTLRHDFVNYDDNEYVYENPAVTGGLSLKGVVWAFTHVHSFNWHPVTWLSHMLDCDLYGLAPWGHHLTSVLLHAATAVLLFLALRQLTSAAGRSPGESLPVRRSSKSEGVWCSAFATALFAIHPLRVESVAWVAERKDVLSGLFFMLTLLAYARYARNAEWRMQNAEWKRQDAARPVLLSILHAAFSISFRSRSYWLVVLFFALGLMSKPMLVTLPFVLLLLDYWPLSRLPADSSFSIRHSAFLISEKLPLFVMSAASCAVTVFAQTEATVAAEKLPMLWRLGNALLAYVIYIGQTAWPVGLAVFYPHRENSLLLSEVILSFLLLAAVSAVVFVLRRKHPYGVTGWLWYLGMLVPVIGLIQAGSHAHADRYTYLPQIGLLIPLAWGMEALSAGWRHRRMVCGAGAALILSAVAACSWIQTSYWRDTSTLWTRALDSTPRNAVAYSILGTELASQGKFTEAVAHYRQALEINPNFAETHSNLGLALALHGKTGEAIEHYLRALEIAPDYADAHNNLANALVKQGKPAEAVEHYLRALEGKPNNADAHNNLGVALAMQGKAAESVGHFRRALEIEPENADAHLNLGNAFAAQGKFEDTIKHYSRALENVPESVAVLNRLGWTLATCPDAALRNGAKAIELARKAERLGGGKNPAVLDTLAAAYAEAGQFPAAVETAGRALDLAVEGNDEAQGEEIRTRLRLYKWGIPYHEEAQKP